MHSAAPEYYMGASTREKEEEDCALVGKEVGARARRRHASFQHAYLVGDIRVNEGDDKYPN